MNSFVARVVLRGGETFIMEQEDCDRMMAMAQDPNLRQIDLRRLNLHIRWVAPWDIQRVETISRPRPALSVHDEQKLLGGPILTQEQIAAKRERGRELMQKMRDDLTKKGILK